jgi:hypothetical protein
VSTSGGRVSSTINFQPPSLLRHKPGVIHRVEYERHSGSPRRMISASLQFIIQYLVCNLSVIVSFLIFVISSPFGRVLSGLRGVCLQGATDERRLGGGG